MTLMLSAPLLLTALAVGLIVGIFQAATLDQRDDAVVHPEAAGDGRGAGASQARG